MYNKFEDDTFHITATSPGNNESSTASVNES